jgi:hypothetical protein
MPLDTARLFRRIWLTNGILLLALLVGGLGLGAYGVLNQLWGSDENGVRPAPGGAQHTDLRPRAIRYDEPERILNSPWTLVQVHYGSNFGASLGGSAGLASVAYDRSLGTGGALVNVMFLPPDGGPGHLLLDRPAHIQSMDFPREHRRFSEEHVDSVPWITYAIAFEDTDQSGRLDHQDAAELYISDLDGGAFRRVLPTGLRVSSTQVLPDRQILVLALDGRGSEHKPDDQLSQRAFRYNPRTGELTTDTVLDSLALTAGRILGRP